MDDAQFWKRQWIPSHRCWAEYLGGVCVRYHYVCGHSSAKTFDNEWYARRMASWHSKENGGCAGRCRRCVNKFPVR